VALAFIGAASVLHGLAPPAQDRGDHKPSLREMRQEKLPASIEALDIAPGSGLAAVGLSDRRVRVWRLDSGEIIHEFTFAEPETDPRQKLEHDVEPLRVRFAPDGKTLAVSYLSRINLYTIGSWREVQSLGVDGEDAERPRPFPQLGRRPPPGDEKADNPGPTLNQIMRDWARLQMQGDGRTRITDFRFAADGSFVLVGYCRGGCYDNVSGNRLGAFPSGNDPVRLWDVRSGRLVWEHVPDREGVIERVVPSPDGRWFAAADKQPGRCRIQLLDLKSGQTVYSLAKIGFPLASPSLLFTPDSHYLISFRAEEGTMKVRPWMHLAKYEASNGEVAAEFSGRYEVRDADLSPDGRWLATTTWRGLRFQIWDMHTLGPVMTKAPKGLTWSGPPVDRIRFSPDGRRLIVASNSRGMLAVFEFEP